MKTKHPYIVPVCTIVQYASQNFVALSIGEVDDKDKLNPTDSFETSEGEWD